MPSEQLVMPPVGTRVVHKDHQKKGSGPVMEVYGHKPAEQEVRLRHADHKVNHKEGHEPGGGRIDVPLPTYHENYTQL